MKKSNTPTVVISACRGIFGIFLMTLPYLFMGCSKSDSESGTPGDADYYLSFKAGGTAALYKSNAMTQVLPISAKKLYSCSLQGYEDITKTDRSLMSMVIWHESAISARTYKNNENAVNSDHDKVPQVIITYIDNNKVSYLSQGVPGVSIPPFDKIVSDVQVNITEVNSTYVSGTFSGTLYKTTDINFATTVKITEGKFRLKRW